MKTLILVLTFILCSSAFSNNPPNPHEPTSKIPSKVVITGICTDLTMELNADGSGEKTYTITCKDGADVCVTMENGSITTHNCDPENVTVTSSSPPHVEQVGHNKKVTFSGN